jgi:predicted  nucleic acid-binding Zn-ribbon protein
MKVILENLYRLQTLDLAGKPLDHAQAAGLRATIPERMLTTYDRARARGKKGIAMVRNHVCTNCRMQVPIAVTASLMGGFVQLCGNCGLYLCLPEPQEPTPAKVPPPLAKSGRAKRKPSLHRSLPHDG